ncbi:MAG: hypothetical protein K9K30_03485 [Burkholderiaceae bacterium]|nr:hypothetical protein [Burkholderiaceae bacterium]
MPRQFKVTVNGREYEVSVLEITSPPAATAPQAAGAVATAPAAPTAAAAMPAAGAGDILAGMGGVVIEVHVSVGQTVQAGDRLLVLEAMKMKAPVVATQAGRISRVLVAPRDAVVGGQVLVTIA